MEDEWLYPTFPLKCVVCAATHKGNITRAIDDGWNVVIYGTSSGPVQFAGCPLHTGEFKTKAVEFLKEKVTIAGCGISLEKDVPERM